MSIVIYEQPSTPVFSKNCAVIRLTTDSHEVQQEVLYYVFVKVLDYLSVGDTITFDFNDDLDVAVSVVFTATDSPVLGAFDVPTQLAAPLALHEYTEELVRYMMANAFFNTFIFSEKGIFISTGDPGFSAQFRLPGTFTFSTSVALTVLEPVATLPYQALILEPGFKVLAEIYFKAEDQYEHITTLEAIPHKIGHVEIDLQATLDQSIQAWMRSRTTSISDILELSERVKPCYVKLYEYFGDPAGLQGSPTLSQEFYVKFGGVSRKALLQAPDFFSGGARWLSRRTGRILTSRTQAEYLSFYKDFGRYQLQVTWKYRDGTTAASAFNTLPSGDERESFPVITANVSYQHISLIFNPGAQEVYGYVVSLFDYDGGSPSFELSQEFVLDDGCYEFIRHFYYLNRYGCLEVFRATGVQDSELAVKRSFSILAVCSDDIPVTGEQHQHSHTAVMSYGARSGVLLSRAQMDALMDMVMGDYTWMEDPNGEFPGALCPIVITDTKIDRGGEDDTVQALEFTYELAINDYDYR